MHSLFICPPFLDPCKNKCSQGSFVSLQIQIPPVHKMQCRLFLQHRQCLARLSQTCDRSAVFQLLSVSAGQGSSVEHAHTRDVSAIAGSCQSISSSTALDRCQSDVIWLIKIRGKKPVLFLYNVLIKQSTKMHLFRNMAAVSSPSC